MYNCTHTHTWTRTELHEYSQNKSGNSYIMTWSWKKLYCFDFHDLNVWVCVRVCICMCSCVSLFIYAYCTIYSNAYILSDIILIADIRFDWIGLKRSWLACFGWVLSNSVKRFSVAVAVAADTVYFAFYFSRFCLYEISRCLFIYCECFSLMAKMAQFIDCVILKNGKWARKIDVNGW